MIKVNIFILVIRSGARDLQGEAPPPLPPQRLPGGDQEAVQQPQGFLHPQGPALLSAQPGQLQQGHEGTHHGPNEGTHHGPNEGSCSTLRSPSHLALGMR